MLNISYTKSYQIDQSNKLINNNFLLFDQSGRRILHKSSSNGDISLI